ncbi:unnamed protein product [[Actinomadura] parvosata subsp. kistnae]|nr:unnamed protein product [Actinomadura parvosata subsp. kistnae]
MHDRRRVLDVVDPAIAMVLPGSQCAVIQVAPVNSNTRLSVPCW